MNTSHHHRTFAQRQGPRKVRGGIKLAGVLQNLKTSDASLTPASATPIFAHEKAAQFLALIESMTEQATFAAGLEYAKSGQTTSMEFKPGVLSAHVQGSAARPYQTHIDVPTFTAEQWQIVIAAMATEAVHVAKLLAGELPSSLDELLAGHQLKLLPTSRQEVSWRCTCGAELAEGKTSMTAVCKHVATVALIAAERIAEHPLLIFTLLGVPAEQLLEQLRQARTMETHGVATAHQETNIPESQFNSMPLESCLDEFWHSPNYGPDLNELEFAPSRSHHVPHALLRRLGPSPMNGRFPLVGLLASVYDAIAAKAQGMREI